MTNNKKRVCIDINLNLKKEFEQLTPFHQQTYEGVLEAGMEAAIFLAQSPTVIKRLINKTELELHNLWVQLDKAENEADETDFRWDRDGKI